MAWPPFPVEQQRSDKIGADPGMTFSWTRVAGPVVEMYSHVCACWQISASLEGSQVPSCPVWLSPRTLR